MCQTSKTCRQSEYFGQVCVEYTGGCPPAPLEGVTTLSALTVPAHGGLRFASDPHIVCRPLRAAPTALCRTGDGSPGSMLASIPGLASGHGQPQSTFPLPFGKGSVLTDPRTVQRRRVLRRTDVTTADRFDEDPRGGPRFPSSPGPDGFTRQTERNSRSCVQDTLCFIPDPGPSPLCGALSRADLVTSHAGG